MLWEEYSAYCWHFQHTVFPAFSTYCISSLHHVRDGNNIREENKNQAWNRQTRQEPGVEQTDKKLNNCLSPLQTNRSYTLEVDNF
jgi:hypothetical protein